MSKLVEQKIREDRGSNKDSKGMIALFNKQVGAASNAPYCASSISYAFRSVEKHFAAQSGVVAFPYTASSQAIKRWFKGKGWLSTDPQDLLHWDGAVGGWTNVGDQWHGHVFMIVGRLTTRDENGNLRLVGIRTIEGNTNAAGSRDGSGIYQLTRMLFPDGMFYPVDSRGRKAGPGHKLWFCDTSRIKGGTWWG